jgi:hypothetical protein
MPSSKQVIVIILAGLLSILLPGCASWLTAVPTVAPLPTLTPSPVITVTSMANMPTAAPINPSTTATVTLTPRVFGTPTPPLGATPTLLPGQTQAPGAVGYSDLVAPEIGYFVAFPREVQPGEDSLLFWSTSGGSSAAVYSLNPDGTPGQNWSVAAEGSLSVSPRATGRDAVYVLAVTNGITTVEQRVYISTTCNQTWFFSPPPEDGCPGDLPDSMQAVSQPFERGRMFWFSRTGEILVLFGDLPTVVGQIEGDNPEEETETDSPPAWVRMPDPYIEGEPETDDTILPPEGLFQPRRGFGKLWRETPGMRDRLGWALSEEIGYEMIFQSEAIGNSEQLYFTDELGAVIRLVPDEQGWLVVAYLDQTPPTPEPPPE